MNNDELSFKTIPCPTCHRVDDDNYCETCGGWGAVKIKGKEATNNDEQGFEAMAKELATVVCIDCDGPASDYQEGENPCTCCKVLSNSEKEVKKTLVKYRATKRDEGWLVRELRGFESAFMVKGSMQQSAFNKILNRYEGGK